MATVNAVINEIKNRNEPAALRDLTPEEISVWNEKPEIWDWEGEGYYGARSTSHGIEMIFVGRHATYVAASKAARRLNVGTPKWHSDIPEPCQEKQELDSMAKYAAALMFEVPSTHAAYREICTAYRAGKFALVEQLFDEEMRRFWSLPDKLDQWERGHQTLKFTA